MKRIAVSIRNRVFSESVMMTLLQTGDFRPIRIPLQPLDMILVECQSANPEIVLIDVTPAPPETTIAGRLNLIEKLRFELPYCKMVMLCDEAHIHSLPVMLCEQSRQDRLTLSFMLRLPPNI